jgi:hypothetical protein
LITLAFRPVHNESPVMIRGAYFRICADGTLRGPDNDVVATYRNGLWQLTHGRHRAFDCSGPVILRVTNSDGRRERMGPYPFVKAAEGAIFAHDGCLAVHDSRKEPGPLVGRWQEVVFLPGV